MAQALRLNGESLCPHARAVEQENHQLAEIMMDLLDRVTELEAEHAETQVRVGDIRDMLTTMGAFCHALAEVADRLNAEL